MPGNEDDFRYFNLDFIRNMLFNLNLMRKSGKGCDLIIVADKKLFKVHRAILAASSPYFHAMLTGELSERNKDRIELHGISAHIFKVILEFIYTGKVRITQNNAQELFCAGDMLNLTGLIDHCTKFFIKELQPHNAVGFYRFADLMNARELKSESEKYIQLNFGQVRNEDEILQLPKDLMEKFISSEHIRIDSEQQVLEFALRWISYDVLNRKQYIFDILKHIRLLLIPLEILKKTISNCPNSSIKVALKAHYYDILQKKYCLVSVNPLPREGANNFIYVLCGSKREPGGLYENAHILYLGLEKFDTSSRKWIPLPDISINRLMPGVATLNGQIYVVGGETDSYEITSSCHRFNPLSGQWKNIANMHTPRCDFGLCALNGYLYAVGGWINDKAPNMCDSIERYDPGADEWTTIGHLSEPRFNMGLVSHGDLLYLVGGCASSRITLSDLKSYNPVTGEWTELPSMSDSRWQMGVAVLGDYLYVVGGSNREEFLNSAERFDLKKKEWSSIPPMKNARSSPAVVVLSGLLYAIGGTQIHELKFYKMHCTVSSVECYDPSRNAWFECSPLTQSRAEGRAVVI